MSEYFSVNGLIGAILMRGNTSLPRPLSEDQRSHYDNVCMCMEDS